jgi:elongation factor Ts
VLVEINCQTDFVARSDEFKQFVDDVCLQIAASSPTFVRREEVGADAIARQRELFAGILKEEDNKSGKTRPEQAVAKILDGKIDKWLSESCLYEQSFIKDESTTIQKVAEGMTAKIGEKIVVRRFVRFELGEGIEKAAAKDFATEVAELAKQ